MLESLYWLYPGMIAPTVSDLIICLIVIIFGWLLQHYVLKYTIKKIAQFFEKKGKQMTSSVIEHLSQEIRHAFFAFVLFFAISFLIETSLFSNAWTRNFFYSIMVYYAFKGLHDVLSYYAEHPESFYINEEKKISLSPFTLRLSNAFLAIIAIVLIASLWQFNLNGFLTGIGLTSVALAFGVRDTSSHIFGGLSRAFDKPFQIGDFITTEDSKVEGVIEDINLRSTLISTSDKGLVYVPNAYLMNRPLYNLSKREKRKIEIPIFLSTKNSEEAIRGVCREVNKQILLHPQTSNEDLILVYIDEFHADYYRMFVSFFIPSNDIHVKYEVQQDILFVIKQLTDQANIQVVDPNRLNINDLVRL